MAGLAKELAHYGGWINLGLLILVVLLLGSVVALAAAARRGERRQREIFEGSRGLDLEALLISHTRERVAMRDDLIVAQRKIATLEAEMRRAKRHAGLNRFDAFEEIGGEQSFTLALLDDAGDGVVIASLVGREGSRVFGKALVAGKADRPLSEEEERAIAAARAAAP